ncbi:LysR family transcriptional regulator [Photobacterium ganghwense]|uniref:LysR family transcriptional regulator n=1 Tax=Photobacterium ganghwense TaxID=320778 RepID=A0A0J1K1H3_9GAMM|nr:LysR family transcriptional regulator [Photobacterium ganghwense]KLV08292.1 LysR family transcriptional regulator [Photobacterium ganghwense]PSU07427.1 LysR family transcriptional regulator [Photobacterium ganghwense]
MKSATFAGLATFEAVARHGSLTQAAKQLHLTTGALSQQIKLLEQRLDLTLFERHSRGLTLTPEGKQLYMVVNNSIEAIEKVLEQLQGPSQNNEVRLKLTPSFAFKWLVPRLQDFYRLHPDIKVLTFADGALVDHRDSGVDLIIDYCQSANAPAKAKLLMEEYLVPVMSPDYFSGADWHLPKSWQNVTLLHDAMPWQGADKDDEWRFWFDSQGWAYENTQGHYFNRTDMAMAAAEAGLGIAMARRALISPFQVQTQVKTPEQATSGTRSSLVSPFEPVPAQAGYYLFQHRTNPAIDAFCHWLKGVASDAGLSD